MGRLPIGLSHHAVCHRISCAWVPAEKAKRSDHFIANRKRRVGTRQLLAEHSSSILERPAVDDQRVVAALYLVSSFRGGARHFGDLGKARVAPGEGRLDPLLLADAIELSALRPAAELDVEIGLERGEQRLTQPHDLVAAVDRLLGHAH
jgi:hypothetical protein